MVLVTNAGETVLHGGDCGGFPAGHHLQNRGSETVLVIEIGTAAFADRHAEYPDVELRATLAGYIHKDESPY